MGVPVPELPSWLAKSFGAGRAGREVPLEASDCGVEGAGDDMI